MCVCTSMLSCSLSRQSIIIVIIAVPHILAGEVLFLANGMEGLNSFRVRRVGPAITAPFWLKHGDWGDGDEDGDGYRGGEA